jgi:hypothetical protein
MQGRAARAFLGAASVLLFARPVAAATRAEILSLAARAADRLASLKAFDRGWEDAIYLDGLLLLAEELEKDAPGSGAGFRVNALGVIAAGTSPISRGDDCGYAMAALDALRVAEDAAAQTSLVAATDGPLAFAEAALRRDATRGPPLSPWWTASGYGPRYWQDDLYTLVPFLAMRGSTRDGLPGDGLARDLAYEWIEAYASDHRKSLDSAPDGDVPSLFVPRGPFLRDPATGLFFHDASTVSGASFWGRGNGWVALGLTRAERYLDRPYGGSRYVDVPDRAELRAWLSRMAATLAHERNASGTWNADVLRRDVYTQAETSGSALFAYLLASGVEEGWLEPAYGPVAAHAFAALAREVDAEGDVHDIQRTGTGPDSLFLASDDPSSNSDFGVGAFLLAAVAVARLPAEELAHLEDPAPAPPRRTFYFPSETVGVVARNPGSAPVKVALGREGAMRSSLVAAGSTVVLRDAPAAGSLLVVAAEGDLNLVGYEAPEREDPAPDEQSARRGAPPLRRGDAIAPVELSDALLEGEATTVGPLDPEAILELLNLATVPARVTVALLDAGGEVLETVPIDLPPRTDRTFSSKRAASLRATNTSPGTAVFLLNRR